MIRTLLVHRAGAGMTIQDLGRPGYLSFGLSRGGAADRLAVSEGAALLKQDEKLAVLEMASTGGEFEATHDLRISLTGAASRASIDGARLAWNASHRLPAGARLSIGGKNTGSYGYLHLGGGIQSSKILNARSAHLTAGIGTLVQTGDQLPVGPDSNTETGLKLHTLPRHDGGTIRLVPSLQTDVFSASEIARFEATEFRRDNHANRMGMRIIPEGRGFNTAVGLKILSEVIIPGDIQITGDGTPFVLLSECQTTGGYPRIGSVLPADLPLVVQASSEAVLRFKFISLREALKAEKQEAKRRRAFNENISPLIRQPHSVANLLAYQLISGATAGDDLERDDR